MSAAILGIIAQGPVYAQEQDAELAKKLANPIASLISFPIQANYDEGIGPDEEGSQWRINFQPVVPISIGEDWNLISRTILPVINQDDIPVAGMGESGIGDILQSGFFSPKELTSNGWTWGVGPVLLLPTGSEDSLTSDQWGLGPTAVALKQTGPWTIGGLTNHVWNVTDDDDKPGINATFLQPFLSYLLPTRTTLTVNSESTYDWDNEEWSIPVNFVIAQMARIGKTPIQLSAGARYWADAPDTGPDGWGYRAQIVFLFPK